jgi:hypothetical protein
MTTPVDKTLTVKSAVDKICNSNQVVLYTDVSVSISVVLFTDISVSVSVVLFTDISVSVSVVLFTDDISKQNNTDRH